MSENQKKIDEARGRLTASSSHCGACTHRQVCFLSKAIGRTLNEHGSNLMTQQSIGDVFFAVGAGCKLFKMKEEKNG